MITLFLEILCRMLITYSIYSNCHTESATLADPSHHNVDQPNCSLEVLKTSHKYMIYEIFDWYNS
jgi:hypothetical protein